MVGVLHDLSCKMFLFRFTKKKFEREARERNEASNNASVTLMAGVSKKLQSPTLYSVVYVKRNLVCKPGKKPTDCCGRGRGWSLFVIILSQDCDSFTSQDPSSRGQSVDISTRFWTLWSQAQDGGIILSSAEATILPRRGGISHSSPALDQRLFRSDGNINYTTSKYFYYPSDLDNV